MVLIDEAENTQIANAYRTLLRACKPFVTAEDRKLIRRAFNFALNAHQGARRKSGELYIFHPLAVATICAKEIGLGTTSIICSLLHDVVEDTEITLEDIEAIFGQKAARIIDGLTKISGFIGQTRSLQAENFRKIILTLSEDVRVILIKLADRLHNMRTLDALPKQTQLKISSETLELFAPMAHRLGFFSIKSELEDLSLKYTEPHVYQELDFKLKSVKPQIIRVTRPFIQPIQEALDKQRFKYEITVRLKSIYSIYKKMKKQGVPFEQIYDIFAVRIILNNSPHEKADCWRVYSIVTDFYLPNPSRLRDWLSTPKANGYESLHTTVMGPNGKWIEVQIRSQRMHEVAEHGYAAHWKYKEGEGMESNLDEWLKKVGDMLTSSDENAIEFFDEFKLNLFASELFVFTPKGLMITLPQNATTLDFAFEIHTDVGLHCIGAKINNKLVPLDHKLKSGDQVEIITSMKQKPTAEWMNYVITAKAKSKIKQALNEEKRKAITEGEKILKDLLKTDTIDNSSKIINSLIDYFQLSSDIELLYRLGNEKISITDLKNAFGVLNIIPGYEIGNTTGNVKIIDLKHNVILISGEPENNYTLAKCCNPIPGDDIFGFVTIGEGIIIHRTNCPAGIRLMSNYGYRIVEAKWLHKQLEDFQPFQVGIRIIGIDSMGMLNVITDIMSKEMKVNMRHITASTRAGSFECSITAEVFDTTHLENLLKRLKNIEGIETVHRFHVDEAITN